MMPWCISNNFLEIIKFINMMFLAQLKNFPYSAGPLTTSDFSLFPKLKIHIKGKICGCGTDSHYINEGISEILSSRMSAKGSILKKINASFIAHFLFGKYSLYLDTFWIQPVYNIYKYIYIYKH